MPILQHWREVWQRAKEYGISEDFPPETASIVNQYAEESYRLCVHWFGPPTNAKEKYRIAQGARSFYVAAFGVPLITISRQSVSSEQLCQEIAHEMYHRVTEGRKGLANKLWIKEIMAILTSQWFLHNQGFDDYANATKKVVIAGKGKADFQTLQSGYSGSQRYIFFGRPVHSTAFAESVWRISYALEAAVKTSSLIIIIKARTLEEWITSLPPEDQYAACRVLELSTENKTVPCNKREMQNLTLAMQAKGDKEALIAELEHIIYLQPANSYAFFQLGYSYQIAERLDDALEAYTKSRELGCLDSWLLYNIGSTYWQAEDHDSAAEWFQKANEQTPDWAQAAYSLGQTLVKSGNIEAARQSWEKVLILPDENYAELAKKALNENPLPGSVTFQKLI